jgi:topoisomerase-4 subunit A
MGNYHPHGDAAIYDAMARLAQDFVIRYPLVDGQGNFGNIDGDNPAASRYTEARMTAMAEALLEGLDEDAVDFRDNYDGTLRSPRFCRPPCPTFWPTGPAGSPWAWPRTFRRTTSASCCAPAHLIKTPDARDDTLLNYVQGPDFPTGGVIVEPPDRIAEAYRTGRGAFRLRATWEVEDLGPRHLADRRHRNPLPGAEIQADRKAGRTDPDQEGPDPRRCPRRERRRHPHRAGTALEKRRSRRADGTLFRNSDLETRFSLNMNVLIDGRTPKVCSLKEVLRAFLDHRRDVSCAARNIGWPRSTIGLRCSKGSSSRS